MPRAAVEGYEDDPVKRLFMLGRLWTAEPISSLKDLKHPSDRPFRAQKTQELHAVSSMLKLYSRSFRQTKQTF